MPSRHMTIHEPTLEEMLTDPIVRIVMRRDGVSEEDIRRLMDRTARKRAA